ncbi:MAG: polysaccharide deacetylase family protein [Lachnospiraceae bacterium]|nr:polysaccharide deacetylase family protein [Lachnospiraceae bacterium]
MTDRSKRIKILITIICCAAIILPSVLLYLSYRDRKMLVSEFDQYRAQSEILLEQEKRLNIEYQKKTDFPALEYDKGDLDYGSCGYALSGTFTEMVVDWREDSVYNPSEKTAYLTFDDGPSERTKEILDILDEYGVKATFFVIGNKNQENEKLYKDIVDRGHTLGMHSQTHIYNKIYASTESFLEDYDQLFTTIVNETGQQPVLFRFPGGSNNAYMKRNGTFTPIKEEMETRGFTYYDWNVSAEDAKYKYISADDITWNVLNGAKNKNLAVVLMHDSANKQTTVEALPGIIEGLEEEGFAIEKLTPSLAPLQFK